MDIVTMAIVNILRRIQWHLVILVVKPALVALGIAIVDVGLLDGAILQAVEGLLREIRLGAAVPK